MANIAKLLNIKDIVEIEKDRGEDLTKDLK